MTVCSMLQFYPAFRRSRCFFMHPMARFFCDAVVPIHRHSISPIVVVFSVYSSTWSDRRIAWRWFMKSFIGSSKVICVSVDEGWNLVAGKRFRYLSECIAERRDILRFGLKLSSENDVIACECMPWTSRERVHEVHRIPFGIS